MCLPFISGIMGLALATGTGLAYFVCPECLSFPAVVSFVFYSSACFPSSVGPPECSVLV